MAMTLVINSPADLAELYRSRSRTCQAAGNSARARSERSLWEAKAKIWEEAADIAATAIIQPEQA